MLLGGLTWLYVVGVCLVLAVATALSARVTVESGTVAAYTVLGEFREMLDPGTHTVTPFVSDISRYEQSPELSVSEEANTADGERVEATVRLDLELGDIERAYETDALPGTDPITELRSEATALLRAEIRGRDTDAVLSAHVDIERALYRDLREYARENYHYLEDVDTMAIERLEQPSAPDN